MIIRSSILFKYSIFLVKNTTNKLF